MGKSEMWRPTGKWEPSFSTLKKKKENPFYCLQVNHTSFAGLCRTKRVGNTNGQCAIPHIETSAIFLCLHPYSLQNRKSEGNISEKNGFTKIK